MAKVINLAERRSENRRSDVLWTIMVNQFFSEGCTWELKQDGCWQAVIKAKSIESMMRIVEKCCVDMAREV